MQEEKQNIYNTQEMNNNPQVDNTQVLIDIKESISFINAILVVMFLLQIGVILHIYMYGIPIVPRWY